MGSRKKKQQLHRIFDPVQLCVYMYALNNAVILSLYDQNEIRDAVNQKEDAGDTDQYREGGKGVYD